jgi:hypothetical protein
MAVKKTAQAKPKAAGNRGKGRKKGVPNKVTKAVKEALEGALNADEGAEAFFIQLRKENPVTFANIVSKLIPIQVDADVKADIDKNVTVTIVRSDGSN